MESELAERLGELQYEVEKPDQAMVRLLVADECERSRFVSVLRWLVDLVISATPGDEYEDLALVNSGGEEEDGFVDGLGVLMRRWCCPYESLTRQALSLALDHRSDRLLILEFLTAEAQAARMLAADQEDSQSAELLVNTSYTADRLKQALITLGCPCPPDSITDATILDKLYVRVERALTADPAQLPPPLWHVKLPLSEVEWAQLVARLEHVRREFQLRRQLLLSRLDVTVQCCQWSERAAECADRLLDCFTPARRQLSEQPSHLIAGLAGLSRLLAARHDLLLHERTCGRRRGSGGVDARLKQLVIGAVPDRGGRPAEQAPVADMPSWRPRQAGPPSHRGGRGGRVQGAGWNRGRGGGRHRR